MNRSCLYTCTGDGMFFQWMMATGALLVGLVFNLIAWPQPPFFSFAMTGGMLWGVGNILTVPTLKLLGMGMTQTMVGIANAVGGIISGRLVTIENNHSCMYNIEFLNITLAIGMQFFMMCVLIK